MPRPYFHQLVLSSTIRDRKLRIPEIFVKKFRDELYTVATLSVPDGRVWHVRLENTDNKIWLQEGWQEFVEWYSISVGYFLVFRYKGNSAFNVYIFNLAAAEINYQSNTFSNTNGNQHFIFEEMEEDESFSTPYPIPDSLKNKVFGGRGDQLTLGKSHNPPGLHNLFNGTKFQNRLNRVNEEKLHEPKIYDNSKTAFESTRDTGVHFGGMALKPPTGEVKLHGPDEEIQRIKKTIRKRQKVDSNKGESSVKHEEEAEMHIRFYASASTRKRTVTAEEREKALNAAKVYEPFNPFCRVVLRPSYLYRGCIMYLPSCFAEKNLNGVSGFIKLQTFDGKQWPVRCLYKGGKAKLSKGWYEFSLDNNLEEGDVCVFELLKMGEILLGVTIFRVLEGGRMVNQPSQKNVSHTKLIRA